MPENKKRAHERYPLEVNIRIGPAFECDPEEQECYQTINVSAGGALLRTSKPLPVGTELTIELELPLEVIQNMLTKRAKIMLNGSVVRLEDDGMAVSFDRKYSVSPVVDC